MTMRMLLPVRAARIGGLFVLLGMLLPLLPAQGQGFMKQAALEEVLRRRHVLLGFARPDGSRLVVADRVRHGVAGM